MMELKLQLLFGCVHAVEVMELCMYYVCACEGVQC